MQRFKNILVVCDENSNADWAVDCARDLAVKNDGRLTLIDVVDFEKADISDVNIAGGVVYAFCTLALHTFNSLSTAPTLS